MRSFATHTCFDQKVMIGGEKTKNQERIYPRPIANKYQHGNIVNGMSFYDHKDVEDSTICLPR